MSGRSSIEQYGTVAKTFHWLTLALVIGLIILAYIMVGITDTSSRLVLYRAHALLGIAVLILTVLRFLWRLADRPPPAPGLTRTEGRLSRLVQRLLYILMIIIPASGLATIVTTGAGPALVGQSGATLPDTFEIVGPRAAHRAMVFLLFALVALHALAAFRHHWWRRDEVLRRMLPNLK